MAADYEPINRAKQMGNRIVRLAELLREVRELSDGIVDSANHCFDGSDYTLFETQAGLTTGHGQNFLFLLNLVNTILNTNSDVTGANRLSQLDEFVARVANQ